MRFQEQIAEIGLVINCRRGVQFEVPRRGQRRRGSFCVNCTLRERGGNVIERKLTKEKNPDVIIGILRDVTGELGRIEGNVLLICSADRKKCRKIGTI